MGFPKFTRVLGVSSELRVSGESRLTTVQTPFQRQANIFPLVTFKQSIENLNLYLHGRMSLHWGSQLPGSMWFQLNLEDLDEQMNQEGWQ